MNQYMNASRRLRALVPVPACLRPPLASRTSLPRASADPSYPSVVPSYSTILRNRLSDWKCNGALLGVAVLAYAGIDCALSVRQDARAARVLDQAALKNRGAEPRLRCVVRKCPGCSTRLGEVVDVIEEGVGPGGRYSFCALAQGGEGGEGRDIAATGAPTLSVGLLPNTCLQKID